MTKALQNNTYSECFDKFDYAEKIVVLTGAGISTLSGIPDFRGKNGVFTRQATWEGISIETLHEIKYFKAHPELFYRFAKEHIYPMLNREPSIAHYTLMELQKRGIIDLLYTQNIDHMHQRAGSAAFELHGTPTGHTCLKCGEYDFTLQEIMEQVSRGQVPRCHCGGLIKPDMVFFGEELDAELLERAFHDFETADIAIVLGSSLTVPPVSTLPLATCCNRGTLIIVNDMPTHCDNQATYHFSDIAEFCRAVCKYFDLSPLNSSSPQDEED